MLAEIRQFWHTTAVVRIAPALDFEFYAGVVNYTYRNISYKAFNQSGWIEESDRRWAPP